MKIDNQLDTTSSTLRQAQDDRENDKRIIMKKIKFALVGCGRIENDKRIIMKKIKFALVGCGRIHKKHVETITKELTDIAELIAVCDIDENKAKTVGETYGAKYGFDFERC